MKILQIPFCFYPDPVGGTEVYVDSLTRNLLDQKVEVVVAAPGSTNRAYWHRRIPVKRYAVSSQVGNLRELYGVGDRKSEIEFGKLLDAEKPDLVHLHALSTGISLSTVREAKKRGIPVIFTYHTPAISCCRGTLLKWGELICEGKLDIKICASCTLNHLGLNKTTANVCSNIPSSIGKVLGDLGCSGGIWTALRMTELVELKYQTFNALMSEVDRVVAVCSWVKQVLIANQVPADKITVSRQGLCHQVPSDSLPQPKVVSRDRQQVCKIAFLGRLHPIKGLHILVKALDLDHSLPIILDIYGVAQGKTGNDYERELISLVERNSRIRFKSPLSAHRVVEVLKTYDALAVPSQWLETGPLVVLEAMAAKVPVIGSNLGGIAELVQHNVNGLLVEHDKILAWHRELRRICQQRQLLERLKSNIEPPRTMVTVAGEMLALYREILNISPTKYNCQV